MKVMALKIFNFRKYSSVRSSGWCAPRVETKGWMRSVNRSFNIATYPTKLISKPCTDKNDDWEHEINPTHCEEWQNVGFVALHIYWNKVRIFNIANSCIAYLINSTNEWKWKNEWNQQEHNSSHSISHVKIWIKIFSIQSENYFSYLSTVKNKSNQ